MAEKLGWTVVHDVETDTDLGFIKGATSISKGELIRFVPKGEEVAGRMYVVDAIARIHEIVGEDEVNAEAEESAPVLAVSSWHTLYVMPYDPEAEPRSLSTRFEINGQNIVVHGPTFG